MGYQEAWDVATRSKARLSRNNTGDFKAQVVSTAVAYQDDWKAWLEVFHDDADMLQRLTKIFPEEARRFIELNCFSAH